MLVSKCRLLLARWPAKLPNTECTLRGLSKRWIHIVLYLTKFQRSVVFWHCSKTSLLRMIKKYYQLCLTGQVKGTDFCTSYVRGHPLWTFPIQVCCSGESWIIYATGVPFTGLRVLMSRALILGSLEQEKLIPKIVKQVFVKLMHNKGYNTWRC